MRLEELLRREGRGKEVKKFYNEIEALQRQAKTWWDIMAEEQKRRVSIGIIHEMDAIRKVIHSCEWILKDLNARVIDWNEGEEE